MSGPIFRCQSCRNAAVTIYTEVIKPQQADGLCELQLSGVREVSWDKSVFVNTHTHTCKHAQTCTDLHSEHACDCCLFSISYA